MILDNLFPLLQSVPYGAARVAGPENPVLEPRRGAHPGPFFPGGSGPQVLRSDGRRRVRRPDARVRRRLFLDALCAGRPYPTLNAGSNAMLLRRAQWVPVTTAVISGVLKGAPLLVYLFEEGGEVEDPATAHLSIRDAHERGNAGVTADHGEAHPHLE